LAGLPETPSRSELSKSELRAAARARRQAAHERFGARIGPVLAANFMSAFSLPPSAIVAGYSPVNGEADVTALLAALSRRGHRLCLPVVAGRDAPLVFRAFAPGDALIPGVWNIPEPAAAREALRPDVVLLPLLAFDAAGRRLGYGGGYYDRTLALLRGADGVFAVGIAYSAQKVDRIPDGDHDQRLDAVLTETGVVRFADRERE
jgi:5-formyltetrahydrofolate cyclo-ligase